MRIIGSFEPTALSALLSLCFLSPTDASLPAQCPTGSIETSFNHCCDAVPNFRAVHMALIPKGPHRGKVLVWDYGVIVEPCTGKSGDQTRWAIVDVSGASPVFNTFTLPHSPNSGDLGCAGHAWTQDGMLLVAGGTTFSFASCPNLPLVGARHVYLFDPSLPLGNGMWVEQMDPSAPLARNR